MQIALLIKINEETVTYFFALYIEIIIPNADPICVELWALNKHISC
jgi:hypothetical protein